MIFDLIFSLIITCLFIYLHTLCFFFVIVVIYVGHGDLSEILFLCVVTRFVRVHHVPLNVLLLLANSADPAH